MMKHAIIGYDGAISNIFRTQLGSKNVASVSDADIVVFTGGADVSPSLYGEEPIPETNTSPTRDNLEVGIYKGLRKDQIKFGICRGGQFLNVMNGGKLWQHVDRHSGRHFLTDVKTKRVIEVTSTHHQMMRPAEGGKVLATASLTHVRKNADGMFSRNYNYFIENDPDVEVVYYSATRSLCFQPHPEYGHIPTEEYAIELLKKVIDNTI